MHDAVTDLIYAQQRYYDPVVGQFLSTDPMDVDTQTGWNFNRYSYGHNNPYSFTDPDGRGIYSKIGKFILTGGDLGLTFAGAIEDYNTLTDSDASFVQRGIAAASLASEFAPVSIRDGKDLTGAIRNISNRRASPDFNNVINDNRASKILGNRDGHLPDTPQNRRLLQDVANDSKTTLGPDRHGNVWSAKTLDDGTQVWTQTRNGEIINGGLNQTPRVYNPETGLSSPTRPNWKKRE